MANDTPSNVQLKQAKLTAPAHRAIGRIIRATAEIEDLVSLAIGGISQLTEAATFTLLGRSPISTRLNILKTLAKMRGVDKDPPFLWLFGTNLTNLIACRNAVAHGLYLGQTPTKGYAFLTAKTLEPQGGNVVQLVNAYSLKTMEAIATAGEQAIPSIENGLGLRSLRQKRREQSLEDYQKGQNQQKDSAKRRRQPRSSRA